MQALRGLLSRRGLTLVSLALYCLALALPSYEFVSKDRQSQIHQIGIQSLVSAPIGIAVFINLLYLGQVAGVLGFRMTRLAGRINSGLMLGLLALCCMAFAMGDPEPGSRTSTGYGAGLWMLSLVVCWLAAFGAD